MVTAFNHSKLIPYRSGQKWSYSDIDKNILFDFVYDEASWFCEGFAKVKRNSKYGIIDERGLQVIPCAYEDVGVYSEGLVKVCFDSKYGFLDLNKDNIIKFKYNSARDFKNGLCCVEINEKFGFIDHKGDYKIEPKFDYAKNFSEGLAIVEMKGKYGFIDAYGNQPIPCIYASAEDFSEGLACVGIQEIGSPVKYGFIDKKGNIVIDFIYRTAKNFHEGLARVEIKNEKYPRKNGNWGLGVSPTTNSRYLTVFIDKSGKEILTLEDELDTRDRVLTDVHNGLIIIGDKYCQTIVNKFGKEILSLKYKYERVEPFFHGLALVLKNERVAGTKDEYESKYGFINIKGEEVISCKYYYAADFRHGFAYASRYTKEGIEEGFINQQGIEYWEGISRKYRTARG